MLPTCLGQCETNANKKDGCEPDDFACHCVNYDVYSKVPFPPFFSSPSNPTQLTLPAHRALRLPTLAWRHRHLLHG
jgi:hypothetical protein